MLLLVGCSGRVPLSLWLFTACVGDVVVVGCCCFNLRKSRKICFTRKGNLNSEFWVFNFVFNIFSSIRKRTRYSVWPLCHLKLLLRNKCLQVIDLVISQCGSWIWWKENSVYTVILRQARLDKDWRCCWNAIMLRVCRTLFKEQQHGWTHILPIIPSKPRKTAA